MFYFKALGTQMHFGRTQIPNNEDSPQLRCWQIYYACVLADSDSECALGFCVYEVERVDELV